MVRKFGIRLPRVFTTLPPISSVTQTPTPVGPWQELHRAFSITTPTFQLAASTWIGVQARPVGTNEWLFLAPLSVNNNAPITELASKTNLIWMGRIFFDTTSNTWRWKFIEAVNDFDTYEFRLVGYTAAANVLNSLVFGASIVGPPTYTVLANTPVQFCTSDSTCTTTLLSNTSKNGLLTLQPTHPLAPFQSVGASCDDCPPTWNDNTYIDLNFDLSSFRYIRKDNAFRAMGASYDFTCPFSGIYTYKLDTTYNFIGAVVLENLSGSQIKSGDYVRGKRISIICSTGIIPRFEITGFEPDSPLPFLDESGINVETTVTTTVRRSTLSVGGVVDVSEETVFQNENNLWCYSSDGAQIDDYAEVKHAVHLRIIINKSSVPDPVAVTLYGTTVEIPARKCQNLPSVYDLSNLSNIVVPEDYQSYFEAIRTAAQNGEYPATLSVQTRGGIYAGSLYTVEQSAVPFLFSGVWNYINGYGSSIPFVLYGDAFASMDPGSPVYGLAPVDGAAKTAFEQKMTNCYCRWFWWTDQKIFAQRLPETTTITDSYLVTFLCRIRLLVPQYYGGKFFDKTKNFIEAFPQRADPYVLAAYYFYDRLSGAYITELSCPGRDNASGEVIPCLSFAVTFAVSREGFFIDYPQITAHLIPASTDSFINTVDPPNQQWRNETQNSFAQSPLPDNEYLARLLPHTFLTTFPTPQINVCGSPYDADLCSPPGPDDDSGCVNIYDTPLLYDKIPLPVMPVRYAVSRKVNDIFIFGGDTSSGTDSPLATSRRGVYPFVAANLERQTGNINCHYLMPITAHKKWNFLLTERKLLTVELDRNGTTVRPAYLEHANACVCEPDTVNQKNYTDFDNAPTKSEHLAARGYKKWYFEQRQLNCDYKTAYGEYELGCRPIYAGASPPCENSVAALPAVVDYCAHQISDSCISVHALKVCSQPTHRVWCYVLNDTYVTNPVLLSLLNSSPRSAALPWQQNKKIVFFSAAYAGTPGTGQYLTLINQPPADIFVFGLDALPVKPTQVRLEITLQHKYVEDLRFVLRAPDGRVFFDTNASTVGFSVLKHYDRAPGAVFDPTKKDEFFSGLGDYLGANFRGGNNDDKPFSNIPLDPPQLEWWGEPVVFALSTYFYSAAGFPFDGRWSIQVFCPRPGDTETRIGVRVRLGFLTDSVPFYEFPGLIPTPAAPTNLTATLETTGGKKFIRLNWTPPAPTTDPTLQPTGISYSLYANSGQQEEVGLLDAGVTTFAYPMSDKPKRKIYTFNIRYRGAFGYGASATVTFTPPIVNTPPRDVVISMLANRRLIVSWSKPDAELSPIGYTAVFTDLNNNDVFTQTNIPSDARSYIAFPQFTAGHVIRAKVCAIYADPADGTAYYGLYAQSVFDVTITEQAPPTCLIDAIDRRVVSPDTDPINTQLPVVFSARGNNVTSNYRLYVQYSRDGGETWLPSFTARTLAGTEITTGNTAGCYAWKAPDESDVTKTTATATCQISGGAVLGAAATITNSGDGYFSCSPPVVTFSQPPSGTGNRRATGTARVVNGKVVGVLITDNGAGYTAAPTITISAPPAADANAFGYPLAAVDPGKYRIRAWFGKENNTTINGAFSEYKNVTIVAPDAYAP